ncbi:MAG: hypothetical protein AAF226_15985 [Verrucomicrobiota bacterium]
MIEGILDTANGKISKHGISSLSLTTDSQTLWTVRGRTGQPLEILDSQEKPLAFSRVTRSGFLGTKEELTTHNGDNTTLIKSPFSTKILRRGKKRPFTLAPIIDEDTEESIGRGFELEGAILIHEDWESSYQLSSPSEDLALVLSFVVFRLWAAQYDNF